MLLVQINFTEVGIRGLCRAAPIAQMFAKETAFLEPDSRAARVR